MQINKRYVSALAFFFCINQYILKSSILNLINLSYIAMFFFLLSLYLKTTVSNH